jgi:hypothetical protein
MSLRTSFTLQPTTPPLRALSPPIDYDKPSKLRLQEAKQWLEDNPTETVSTASRLYKLGYTTIYSAIKRQITQPHGGHNKVLEAHEATAIHTYIRDLLSYSIQPTDKLVFQSICVLKKAADPEAKAPSKAWFAKWWKANHLYKIKSKPLAVLRIDAQDTLQISSWFRAYKRTITEKGILRKDILNFDETGFRIGCPKGQSLLVPTDVTEVSLLLIAVHYN